MSKRSLGSLGFVVVLPFLVAAKGQGCGDGGAFSHSEAPDMSGTWDVAYDDQLDVEITIGGVVYESHLGAHGGAITIDHEGQPITFDLDCSRPDVVCPSEVWPKQVSFRQDDPAYPHRVWMTMPVTECKGALVEPDPATCGADTNNPDCAKVCEGASVTTSHEVFGTIDETGHDVWIGLGATAASNGLNCLMIGGSYAQGALTTDGSAATEDWNATASSGDVVTVFAGGCLWAGDPNMDGKLEALVLSGTIKLTTGFSATKE